jgi:hypothetical protein
MRAVQAVVACLLLLLAAAPVLAHVPAFPEDNTAPERAVVVPDAVKSWSFYDTLGTGGATYYRLSLAAGQRLRLGTFTPLAGSFTPSMVLMSPSLPAADRVPPGVTVPGGMGAVVVEGDRPGQASYEPFAPSANYHTASVDRPVDADATYLLAVYEAANRSGPVGVTVGSAESFSLAEYLLVPFDLVRTHVWAGQHPLVAVGPFFLTLLVGGAVVGRRRREARSWSLERLVIFGAGLTVLGSGANTAVQMGLALARTGPTAGALVTAVFVVVPVACGGWALWLARRRAGGFTIRTRVGLAVAGLAALATWAGFLVGPALLLAVALVPRRWVPTRR